MEWVRRVFRRPADPIESILANVVIAGGVHDCYVHPIVKCLGLYGNLLRHDKVICIEEAQVWRRSVVDPRLAGPSKALVCLTNNPDSRVSSLSGVGDLCRFDP